MSLFRRTKQVAESGVEGTTPIGEAASRSNVTIAGQIVRMQFRPTSELPTMIISIRDTTGTAIATWTGRRELGGIALGRKIKITGVGATTSGLLTFVNPEYELLA